MLVIKKARHNSRRIYRCSVKTTFIPVNSYSFGAAIMPKARDDSNKKLPGRGGGVFSHGVENLLDNGRPLGFIE